MSRAAKATLIASAVFASVTIWGVHFMQRREHDTLYKGVLRDDERRNEKMRTRQAEFEESTRKRELYERLQPVTGKADT